MFAAVSVQLIPLIEHKQFCIQRVHQCFSVRLEAAAQGLHKVYPSDVQNSFTAQSMCVQRPQSTQGIGYYFRIRLNIQRSDSEWNK